MTRTAFFVALAITGGIGNAAADPPKLILFASPDCRKAITKTVELFEKRESCQVNVVYRAPGVLVSHIRVGTDPDVFLAPLSHQAAVATDFEKPVNVARNGLAILVRKGNPKGLKELADIAKPGIKVGIVNRQQSVVGKAWASAIADAGLADKRRNNKESVAPSSAQLVSQFVNSPKLDAVLVLRSHAFGLGKKFDMLRIDGKKFSIIQSVSIHKKSGSPELCDRLIRALRSNDSKKRFETAGFEWIEDEKKAMP